MRLLLLKATIPGGAHADLFASAVQVKGYTNTHGGYVAPHESTRHKRVAGDSRLLLPTGAPRDQVQETTKMTVIRQAGPYTISTGPDGLLCNGKPVTSYSPKSGERGPSGDLLARVVDTGEVGANGKPDMVGLTAKQWQVHLDEVATRRAADEAAFRSSDQGKAETARRKSERAYDLGNNEGGEGYNPHRFGSAPTYRSGDIYGRRDLGGA